MRKDFVVCLILILTSGFAVDMQRDDGLSIDQEQKVINEGMFKCERKKKDGASWDKWRQ